MVATVLDSGLLDATVLDNGLLVATVLDNGLLVATVLESGLLGSLNRSNDKTETKHSWITSLGGHQQDSTRDRHGH